MSRLIWLILLIPCELCAGIITFQFEGVVISEAEALSDPLVDQFANDGVSRDPTGDYSGLYGQTVSGLFSYDDQQVESPGSLESSHLDVFRANGSSDLRIQVDVGEAVHVTASPIVSGSVSLSHGTPTSEPRDAFVFGVNRAGVEGQTIRLIDTSAEAFGGGLSGMLPSVLPDLSSFDLALGFARTGDSSFYYSITSLSLCDECVFRIDPPRAVVPLPGAVWLFLTGLGLMGIRAKLQQPNPA